MPRPAKKAKTKGKGPAADLSNGSTEPHAVTAVAEPPAFEEAPPPRPVALAEPEKTDRRPPPEKVEKRRPSDKDSEPPAPTDKDHIAASLNIAKLQSMSMTDLNHMARELAVENFGTMRKHEVIFH